MLELYGVTRSRASRIVWLCHELGLPFRQIPVIQAYRLPDPTAADAPLNTLSPEFLALSPAGAIPVIRDGDLVLMESLACNLHIARHHGGALGPADAAQDALMQQWSLYGATAIEPDALTILYLHKPGQAQPGAAQAQVANAAERLIRPLRVIDQQLALHGHMVADRFTVADINMAEIIRYAQSHHELMSQFPAVLSWLERCQSRDAFRKMWQERLAEPE
ncbi:glutathione S-transferase family protein [Paracoccus shanxieyensis]|uniref:Glutathione S-transferase family protein n=1 Tax=Paracoccus shanxieyensis TaxID=2675752 RepID=A0A6L6IUY0_9RHOB|nr:glutathione S-transferase family protein [Paracoccus shanxieyensis]MTH63398.1 glutathione S-transferase family protein [Paracoccus shanxieyensis]MTH86319.1 glutathione S-transferase family protein [Paracoccus shanxieyensis]